MVAAHTAATAAGTSYVEEAYKAQRAFPLTGCC